MACLHYCGQDFLGQREEERTRVSGVMCCNLCVGMSFGGGRICRHGACSASIVCMMGGLVVRGGLHVVCSARAGQERGMGREATHVLQGKFPAVRARFDEIPAVERCETGFQLCGPAASPTTAFVRQGKL
jgi:hypothetical protein